MTGFVIAVSFLFVVIFVRYLMILRFNVLMGLQFEDYWFLLQQADLGCRDKDTRYKALQDHREALFESLFFKNPLLLAIDLRATTYLDWTANSVLWEEMNSLVPINAVDFLNRTKAKGE